MKKQQPKKETIFEILQNKMESSIWGILGKFVLCMCCVCLRLVLEVLRPLNLKKLDISEKALEIIFNGFLKNAKKSEIGDRFIDVGLENVAVAVARVVE